MDKEESLRDGKRLFYFEFYSAPQLHYLDEALANNTDYEHGAFSFTAILPADDKRINFIEEVFSQKYVKCSLKKDLPILPKSELFLPGIVEFSYYIKQEYYSESELPYFSDAYLCIDSLEPLKNDVLLSRIDEIFANINSGISVSDIPEINSTNSDNDAIKCGVTVKIYRLGGANAAYATYPNKKSLLIDCGCDRYIPNKYINTMIDINKNVRPSGIIISHWHIDHYALFTNINYSNLEFIVVPSMQGMPDNISIKIYELQQKKSAILYALDLGPVPKNWLSSHGFCNTSMYIGNGVLPHPNAGFGDLGYRDSCNESAIIMRIGTSYKSLILPSDVSYFNWPKNINPELQFTRNHRLVVPHHGQKVYVDNTPKHTIEGATLYVSSAFKSIKNYIPYPSHSIYLDQILKYNYSYTYNYSENFKKYKSVYL